MKLRQAMVCSSNQNRSMEAHALLKREGFLVASYGTGQHVKLPGPSLREPNVYDSPYKHMLEDLRRKDPKLYRRNGILPMLKRNVGVKTAPQRWQDNADDGTFDVVLTFEEKVFDMVVQGLQVYQHNRLFFYSDTIVKLLDLIFIYLFIY
ncbi:RNA polymerase ii subunit a c-terminal domain phosphatase ssu72 [Phtheirospermum japonicum]|uniref:RNA polymerase II subunit A C-terminal domain phosphatase SSU72 n=1 Tax=Phtheirospermum japonicum TaxID=374723 RepID=A0A830BV29_9LAMI|nr:RNA polymerase ii subunit a c-terminal domain phosphatase ssu72 [Phtheirospermum japonicum]